MLKDLWFEVIQTCPNNCEFCSSNSSKEATKIISLELFKKTIEHFLSQGGIEEISISGGEPFLHPDFFEMVEFCKSKGIRTVVFTSGIKQAQKLTQEEIKQIETKLAHDMREIEQNEPENERLKKNVKSFYEKMLNPEEFDPISVQEFERLKELGLDKIVFDYQAVEEETDNKLMGRKHLMTSLITSLIRAREVGLNVDVHFIPMKPNYREFPDLIECMEIAEVKNISILNFVPQGRGKLNQEELMLSQEEWKEFSKILEKAGRKFKGKIRIGIPLLGNMKHLCTAGTEKLDIKYDGTVLPCPAFKELSMKTMEKYGIRLYNIYEDLENIVVKGGKRAEPLCRQIYEFNGTLNSGEDR